MRRDSTCIAWCSHVQLQPIRTPVFSEWRCLYFESGVHPIPVAKIRARALIPSSWIPSRLCDTQIRISQLLSTEILALAHLWPTELCHRRPAYDLWEPSELRELVGHGGIEFHVTDSKMQQVCPCPRLVLLSALLWSLFGSAALFHAATMHLFY